MRRVARSVSCIVAIFFVAACTGTETGNPGFSGGALIASNANIAGVAGADDDAPIVVSATWMSIEDLNVLSGDICGTPDAHVDVPGSTVLDFFGTSARAFDVATGVYCGVRLRLRHPIAPLPTGAPSELENAVLVVHGARDDGTPFIYVSDYRETLELRALSGAAFAIDEENGSVLFAMDVSVLFATADLREASVGEGGVIHITINSNETLHHALDEQIKLALTLRRDANGDGVLSGDEAELPPLATWMEGLAPQP